MPYFDPDNSFNNFFACIARFCYLLFIILLFSSMIYFIIWAFLTANDNISIQLNLYEVGKFIEVMEK